MSRIMSATLSVVLLGLGGCSSNEPPPDFKIDYSELTKQLNEMCSTLEAIPDRFDLATQKKIDTAQELLDATAEKLKEQASQYHDSWEELLAHGNMTGEFDDSVLDKHIEAQDRFDTEWKRISSKNEPAFEKLWSIKQMIDDATSA